MDKIATTHLSRLAYVYVRQSTLGQLQHNVENMRMKIEVFAIGVEGENKGRNAFREIEGELEGLGDGFLSEGRDVPEKAAVALKEGTKQLGQGQDEVAVWDGEENVIDEVCGGGLDLALMAGRAEPSTFAGES